MKNLINELKIKITNWSVSRLHGKKAEFWLATFSFSEASFFLIPPDVLLIAILGANARRWIYYSSLTTVFSVLGGILGYLIGFLFFDVVGEHLISLYNLQSQMAYVSEKFADNAFWAVFVSAFTPVPYKIFTISAGFFKINFINFMVASLLGRGMRFFTVGFVMKKYGEKLTNYFFKYFNVVSIIIVVLIVAWFVLV
ncbi:hypothetical protein A2442_00885 [Candidatus Campbellbacteria bacterium RIFOXYC2_FULL_35_25]|uniref:VTT domain-containing protein n=1 Tax=Candidatus Campbellbacteria bacterium RIFOXYC2_FULL_35_25 TaxID=1797582 RepID=A0A1F5EIR0_9BACT|nr:MAG: hypothetical protein A2442_00885 [Candidatus Campbellbacteria bacterium RIFOXYC2_FULL_35_25]